MPPVITFNETFDRRPVSANARSGRKLTRTFEAETDDPANTSGVLVVNQLGTQLAIYIGVRHPNWSYAYCTAIDPQPDSTDPQLWIVTLQYEEPSIVRGTLPGVRTPDGSGAGHGQPATPPEPADRPPSFSFSSRMMDVFDVGDLDSVRIINTANDPFENVPPRRISMLVINYTKWYDDYSPTLANSWVNKVNLTAWNGFAADSVLIETCSATPKTEKGRLFWEVPFTLVVNPFKWIPTKILSVGRRQIVAFQKQLIFDPATNREMPGLTLLDVNGLKTDIPYFIPFRFHDRIEFSGL